MFCSSTLPLQRRPQVSACLVVGNLPYYITSPILLKLAASYAALDRAVLMVQREVADRIAAGPGSRDYGLLSVTVQLYGSVEKLFTLPPTVFSPPTRRPFDGLPLAICTAHHRAWGRRSQLSTLRAPGLRAKAQDSGPTTSALPVMRLSR